MNTATILDDKILSLKRDILALCQRCGATGAHLGGCMSAAEILAVLYCRIMRFDEGGRPIDKVVLSKAHASIALYAAMHQAGLISDEEMQQPLLGDETFIFKHSRRNPERFIEMSGGSLGNGLPFAAGLAWAMSGAHDDPGHVYAIVGDGECNEGTIWETASLMGHVGLANFTVIVDMNGLQLDGYTKDIQRADNMAARWAAFGFDAVEVDGHDAEQLEAALRRPSSGPKAVIARTIKGNGVSFAHDNVDWHQNVVTPELYEIALSELEGK